MLLAFYWKFSDPSFLDFLMKDSFNYDLRKNGESNQDIWFYFRLISYLTVWTVFGYQTYGSHYYWSDQSRILQYGLYLPGFGFPKKPLLVLCIAAQLAMVKAVTSIKVLTHDPGIHFAMAPIRAVIGTRDTIIPRQVQSQVRKQIRPMVAIAVTASTFSYLVYLSSTFAGFVINLKSPMTWNTFLILCLWTIMGALNGRQYTMNAVGLMVILEVISLTLRLSAENCFQSSDQGEPADKKKVLKQFSDGVQLVNSVRNYNNFLKTVIGMNLEFVFSFATVGTFVLVTSEFGWPSLLVCPTIIFCWIVFAAIIASASKFAAIVNEVRLTLIRSSADHVWSPIERYRMNRVLNGMVHRTGLTAFDYIPLHRLMMITVSSSRTVLFSELTSRFQVSFEIVSYVLILVVAYR